MAFNRLDLARVASASTGAHAMWLYLSDVDDVQTALDPSYFGSVAPQLKENDVICGRFSDRYAWLVVTSRNTKENSVVVAETNFGAASAIDALNWRDNGAWVGGTYEANYMVYHDGWTMVSNKTTEQNPAPFKIGDPGWAVFDTTPTWADQSVSGTRVLTGLRIDFPKNYSESVLRVWIPKLAEDVSYYLLIQKPEVTPQYIELSPQNVGWHYITYLSAFFTAEDTIDVYLVTQGGGTSTTTFTMRSNYRFTGANPNPVNPPPQDNMRHYNTNAPDTIYWNVYDQTLADRTADLSTLKAGDDITFLWDDGINSTTWKLTETPVLYINADPTLNFFDTRISPAEESQEPSPQGYKNITGIVYDDRPIEYVQETDKFLNNPNLRGLFSESDLASVVENDNAYGVDLFLQEWGKPSDWDVAAAPSLESDVSLAQIPDLQEVLRAASLVSQAPSAVNTPQVIEFGAAQNTEANQVMIDVNGVVTFNVTGVYSIRVVLSVSRDTAPGIAYFFLRGRFDGVQVGNPVSVIMTDDEMTIPLEFTYAGNISAGTTMDFEMVRDGAGVNDGSLDSRASSIAWGNSPSASLVINRLS